MKLKREGASEVTLTARRLFTHAHTPLHTANTQTITDAALSIDFLLLISIAGKTGSEGEDISPRIRPKRMRRNSPFYRPEELHAHGAVKIASMLCRATCQAI